ncbi:cytochrome c biogenesis protein DipZ [Gordonia sp. TBRC 11910]|uniref:Cytochrome c biogenesis protein DipZ n=1 Tax=Gordonia asplenii TaxID=2725283 RepID=A0A848L4Q6_9ACTN|nr:cytochrome c biogenesis protein DipZ [Gordonia asplenii]NMO04025.1 cytochrome c biogenesis protein DipZ [Gordonia asplenii]
MLTLILIGFLGGLITGVSPCILPVLPVIFLAGTQNASGPAEREAEPNVVDRDRSRIGRVRRTYARLGPYRVIAGLVVSFSAVTLIGSAALSLLRLPQDTIRWAGLVVLTLIGLSLIFPSLERLLERPFARLPQRPVAAGKSGFGLGLALGVLYVPCAGPVLAAIVVAGASGNIGLPTVVLTLSFAVGAALPMLVFTLAGRRIAERVSAFRRRQRTVRIVTGVVMIALALGLVFNLPAIVQRAVPDYTSPLQNAVGDPSQLQNKLNLGGIVNDQNRELSNCSNGATALQNCGTAPELTGITEWLNTADGAPVDLHALRGKVVLIDFWAYSCINCQRAIPHVVDWYDTYRTAGFEVIGVHTPEYAFERVPANVASGAQRLRIDYPIALDPSYSTWTTYRNSYWPAEYLIDATGTVRHIKFGEGGYDVTEGHIRRLLADAHPGVTLPAPTDVKDTTPTTRTTAETYFAVSKAINYGGSGVYDVGTAGFTLPATLPADSFGLAGRWTLDHQGATAAGPDSVIALNYHAKNVYVVAGGSGTVTVRQDGRVRQIHITGPPTLHQIAGASVSGPQYLQVELSQGLQAFSFTYG